MKLLIYSHFFAPSVGGVETIVLSLASGLSDIVNSNGFQEFQITLVTQTPVGEFDDGSLTFEVIRRPGFRRLWRLVSSADIVHVAGPALSPLALGLFMRKHVIIEHHGFQTICPTGQLLMERTNTACPGHFMAGHHSECLGCRSNNKWLLTWKLWALTFVRRFLCARAAANITPTEWLASLLHFSNNVSIPHGLKSIASTRNPANPPVIVFQGRLVSTKGVRLLLEAAKVLRSKGHLFEVAVIGDGPDRSELEDFVRKLQLSSYVRFLGRLDPTEVESTFAKASIVVVPSLAGEVFGLVAAENMARGLAIVASDLGAFTEILSDTALTFRTGDSEDLANKLAILLNDPALGPVMGARAKQRVRQCYPVSRMIDSHARVYRQIFHKGY